LALLPHSFLPPSHRALTQPEGANHGLPRATVAPQCHQDHDALCFFPSSLT
jgi:hypothetical protein